MWKIIESKYGERDFVERIGRTDIQFHLQTWHDIVRSVETTNILGWKIISDMVRIISDGVDKLIPASQYVNLK